MSWSLTYFKTPLVGTIVNSGNTAVNDLLNKFTVEETVGDEYEIKSGDLSLETYTALPFDSSGDYHNWLALYWNSTLFNVYYMGLAENVALESSNDKTGKYSYRLISIQQKFYDDLADTAVSDPGTSLGAFNFWGYELGGNSEVEIQEIVTEPPGFSSVTSRFGFSLGDILANLIGSAASKVNGHGYYCSAYSFPSDLVEKDNNDLPILFRGQSSAFSTTPATIVTAVNTALNGLYWIDLFKMACYIYNCYLQVIPKITSNTLNIEYHLIPKTDASASGSAATWIERELVYRKYRITGVKLAIGNRDFSTGNVNTDDIVDVTVDVSDPAEIIDADNTTLYLARGTYNAGGDDYDILTGSVGFEENLGYVNLTDFESYYSGLITAGDGYNGRIEFGGERALSQITFNSITIQLTRLSIDLKGFANIEGAKL